MAARFLNPREIALLVPMPRVLTALGFAVNERTRRAPCILHGGSNVSAFSWTETGLWKCHSCGEGGDRIALIRAVRDCSFRGAVDFLATLAGVTYSHQKQSRAEIEQSRNHRKRAEQAAWELFDKVAALRSYYADALRRAERLATRIMERANQTDDLDAGWDALSRLGPALTFFLAAFDFSWSPDAETLARFALVSPSERRELILEGSESKNAIAA